MGATAEQYQEALADMEAVELTFQSAAASADATSGQRDAAWAKEIEELSGGMIKIKVVYGNAIAPPAEMAAALRDGRLDIAHWFTTYHPDEMKAFMDLQTSLVDIEASPVIGEISQHLVSQEVAFNTEEVMAEFESQGLTPLNPVLTTGATLMACQEEKDSAGDFTGDQIRVNATAQTQQVNALGASTVTMQLAETYEGLQRGVIQCTVGAATTMLNSGWAETAKHVYTPMGSSFGLGAGSLVAGASWDQLPLAAQQLIFDSVMVHNRAELGQAMVSTLELSEQTTTRGGGLHFLDETSSAAIAEGNETLLDGVRHSDNLDGAKLLGDIEASAEKWRGIAEELGYSDDGDYLNFRDWYQGSGDVVDEEYFGPIIDSFYDEVLAEHRPE